MIKPKKIENHGIYVIPRYIDCGEFCYDYDLNHNFRENNKKQILKE
jgi:hypothetical protein